MSQPSFLPIPPSQLGGAIAVNVFAVLSTIALVSVALRVTWLAIQRYWLKSLGEVREYVFFNTQLGQYAACLIIAMIFNTVAGIIGIPWLFHGGITEGWICRSQALVMQIGSFAAAYFTVTIAVHTFGSLVLRKRQSALLCRSVIGMGWLLAGLMGAAPFLISRPEGFVYGADGLACGVRSIFPKLQFFFHLLPILLASVLGAILYSLIFLVLRGTLKIKGGLRITLNPNERWNNSHGLGENYHRFVARVAKSMLWYPVAYIALLVPYSIMRLLVISGFTVSFEAIVFAFVCWYSLSVVDVLLLYNTFRVLGPAFDGRTTAATSRKDWESFSTSGQLEKYGAFSPKQRSAIGEKVEVYRSQGSYPYRPPSETSFSTSSGKSTQDLLPTSVRPSTPLIGRSITPAADYGYIIPSPLPVASPTYLNRQLSQHSRTDSGSSAGLSVPPRRMTRSPMISPVQVSEQLHTPAKSTNTRHSDEWISRQRSTQTFGHQSPRTLSWASESDNMDEYASRSGVWSYYQEQPANGRPMLSAVSASIAQQVSYPRSPPPSATLDRSRSEQAHPNSSPRMRPLLLSRINSTSTKPPTPTHF